MRTAPQWTDMPDRQDAPLAPLEYGPVIRADTPAWDILTTAHGVPAIGGTGRAVAASAGGGTPARTGIGFRLPSTLTQTRIPRLTWRPGFGIGAISIKIIIPMLGLPFGVAGCPTRMTRSPVVGSRLNAPHRPSANAWYFSYVTTLSLARGPSD